MSIHPLIQAILLQAGTRAAGSLFGGGPSPSETATQQQMGIGSTLIPQLQRQAAGLPTAATDAQLQQIRQAQTRAQQSYVQSAGRGGLVGGVGATPVRAQQGRMMAAGTQAMAGVMGQAQQQATQALMGLYTGGVQAQQQTELREVMARNQFMSDLAVFMQYYKKDKQNPLVKELGDWIKGLIRGQGGTAAPLATAAPAGD